MNKYVDIIDLEHPTSKIHPRMNKEDRAAQFAPFAALTGYAEAINEVGRLVDKKRELTDEEKLIISNRINYLIENKDKDYEVIIIYFIADLKKDGGKYLSINGVIKKVDIVNRFIMVNKKKIYIEDIIMINSNIFDEF